MTAVPESWQGQWIWSENAPERNAFVRFRRKFNYSGGQALLHLTADARYALYLNGAYLGHGPVRAWPNHWRYDSYDLSAELVPGENVITVLVNHFEDGNFQYIPAPPGLLAQLELKDETIVSDASWKASLDAASISAVPRISVQEWFEEQYDARLSDNWTALDYDDSAWAPAVALRESLGGPHQNLEPRAIPYLTLEPVLPQRVLSVESVKSLAYSVAVPIKKYLLPGDSSSRTLVSHSYLATQIYAPQESQVNFVFTHKLPGEIKLNGELLARAADNPVEEGINWSIDVQKSSATLRAGWNDLLVTVPNLSHLQEFVFNIDGPAGLVFNINGQQDAGAQWAVIGPFGLRPHDIAHIAEGFEDGLQAVPISEQATAERGDEVWASGAVASLLGESFVQLVNPNTVPAADVFTQAYTDKVTDGDLKIDNLDGLLSAAEWTTVHPTADGSDVRLLVDWGQEVIGFHQFEVFASAGTIIDVHNFEFIQPDGRLNFAEGMNNTFRYTCREGLQTYKTNQRRGFGYSYIILRNLTSPVKLRGVQVLFSTYPQSRRGKFASSDAKLDRIWQVGAHTLRVCAEDTYTDCPSYEQTNWVGDARNEALIDWVINGDPRLWFRCLEQTGQSLERSPLTESNVPSAWPNILPAWSFLWMRSCREFLRYTGDLEKSRQLLGYIERNVQGIRDHINEKGLFSIRAWNMFDWAEMDTPNYGVVTHNNFFVAHSLRDAADMADILGETALASSYRELADSVSKAANAHLWNEDKQAYTDCLRGTEHSAVYSQQTQTVAFMSGVAADHSPERAERSSAMMHHPPADFVKAGSPFFEFFLLEAYVKEEKDQEFLETIRRDWGFMIDMGATTFWEMWSGRTGRLTRSHCHGWSAAPTFFLSTQVLGVRPDGEGFSPVLVEPHPGDLTWCRGVVPTPAGDVEVQWENEPGQPFILRVNAPQGVPVNVRLPREGAATVNGVAV